MNREDWKLDGEGRMSDGQRRLLNAACGDLARCLNWFGNRLDKDDWRHLICGTILGLREVPGIDLGEGPRGIVMLGGSSLRLSRTQATEAITMAFWIGDDPAAQGLRCRRVDWCDVVCLARGITDSERCAA